MVTLVPLAGAADEATGTVLLSDGRAVKGTLYVTGKQPLKLYDLARKSYRQVPLAHLRALVFVTLKAELVEHWTFEEEGKHKKIYSGKRYPEKRYECRVELKDGTRFAAQVSTTLYCEVDDETRERFILREAHLGEPGDTLESLVHPTSVRFDGPGYAPARLLVRGAFDRKAKAQAISIATNEILSAARDPAGLVFAALPPGTYDLAVESGGRLWLGLGGPEGAEARPLPNDVAKALLARARDIEGFFPDQRLVAAAGSPEAARVLLDRRRDAKSTTIEAKDKDYLYRSVEVWTMRRSEIRWLVYDRSLVFREQVRPPGDGTPVRLVPAFGGVRVAPGAQLEVAVPGEDDSKKEARKP